MPGGASKLRDVSKLADAQAVLSLDVALNELPELPTGLVRGGGPLQVQVQFTRERGRPVAQVDVVGQLQLVCQRCLQPMSWPVQLNSSVVLVAAQSQADETPTEQETFLAADGRVSVAALAGEELLLSLPIVPLHADASVCGVQVVPQAEAAVPETGAEEVVRPFADLRALLAQGTKPKN